MVYNLPAALTHFLLFIPFKLMTLKHLWWRNVSRTKVHNLLWRTCVTHTLEIQLCVHFSFWFHVIVLFKLRYSYFACTLKQFMRHTMLSEQQCKQELTWVWMGCRACNEVQKSLTQIYSLPIHESIVQYERMPWVALAHNAHKLNLKDALA